MRRILTTSIADSVLLKNRHNELFLRLMDSLERDKEASRSPVRLSTVYADDDELVGPDFP